MGTIGFTMATARKRTESKARTGTAGKKKTAQRKSPGKSARTKTTGRVKSAGDGPVTRTHPQSEPTKRASSRRRAAESGEPISGTAAKKPRKKTSDIGDADVAKVKSLASARARDRGENAG